MILTAYAAIMLLFWIIVCVYLVVSTRKITFLKDLTPSENHNCPSISIIIAVKDEEAEVEEALQSVCQLDYPHLHIIVINDRSTDGTSAILDRMKQHHARLNIITVNQLQEGWLGKNHAMYQGYLASSDEWLLFTDADVKVQTADAEKSDAVCARKATGSSHLTTPGDVTLLTF
jgi:cellulose synthase/poly-beta-1,6-N-acetylglucosamine synthase-like glycosyltransferase